MKKLFCSLLVILFFITGCNKNKEVVYKCSFKNQDNKIVEDVTGTFKNDKLQSTVTNIVFDLNDYLQYENMDSYYEKFLETYKSYNDYEGIDVEIEKGDTYIKIKMFTDFNKVPDEVYANLNIKKDKSTILSQTFIKNYTDEGYTCE